MKKTLTYALLLLFSFGIAQKMAYVDTQYILKQLPQYQQSEQRLDHEVKKWQEEIVNRQSMLEKLRIEYENEKVLLTEDQQKSRLMSIDSTDKALHEFIEKKFGSKGESVNLRINLVKPIQDQIWNAINAIAIKDKYNLILDKSSDLIMVYTDSKYDITDKVLKQLGIATKKKEDKNGKSSSMISNSDEVDDKEVKIINVKNSDETAIDKKDKESTKKQQKSGWGRKYVPKNKQTKKEQIQKEEVNEVSSEKVDEVSEVKNINNVKSKDYPKEEDVHEITAPAPKNKESKTVNNKESKTTIKSQPKSGYGSKYIPKKKTQNNNQTNDKTSK